MTLYFADLTASALSLFFIVFTIAALGYIIGGFSIKGISLGTAGVLLVALIWGIIVSYIPEFSIGKSTILLFDEAIKSHFNMISGFGTTLFVTAIGLIAGPKFFRTMNKSSFTYLLNGIIIILLGTLTALFFLKIDKSLSPEMAIGLMTGGLTSTPGLAAAKEAAAQVAGEVSTTGAIRDPNQLVAGYGIAYIFGILGVVFFVQIVPKILKVDIKKERERFVAASAVSIPKPKGTLKQLDPFGFFPFFLAIALGCLIGAIKIPGINFSLGKSGGTLVAGLIIGHLQHIGPIDCRLKKETLNFFRELGLVLFLIGAGVPGGANFVGNVKLSYFIYGGIMTCVPMIVGFLIGKYVFRLKIFNNLGSITGGMTSTPALGTLIQTAGTDEVASAYATTYPIALVAIVLATKLVIMFA
ncbi:MAG TPA: YidE/YbjL duplication [Treponemataceae bacterium]|nr:YidE/YbjL duplication [Treponemataceae bacterium]